MKKDSPLPSAKNLKPKSNGETSRPLKTKKKPTTPLNPKTPVKPKTVRPRKKKPLPPTLRKLPWPLGLTALLLFLFALNFCYQVLHKPAEIVGLFDSHFHKSPSETWRNYGGAFIAKSTQIMTPDLLASLAQVESNGNPIVRTYWRWHWSRDLSKIFAPASSAVGMFQITEGTFNEARHYCAKEGLAFDDKTHDHVCFRNVTYSRLVPEHAIEMTSARLHRVTENLIRHSKRWRNWSLRDKQDVAIVIHLCGAAKAERLVRSGMHFTELGSCGDHEPATYAHQVHRLQTQFRLLREGHSRLASNTSTLQD